MIIASAIRLNENVSVRYLDKTGEVYEKIFEKPIFCGKRHGDAIMSAYKILKLDPDKESDRLMIHRADYGFITCDGKYLEREEAKIYAMSHFQYRPPEIIKQNAGRHLYDGPELFSEDLW